ncbi:MAG: WecB/TagA/CpsF family glycosyltransferase [Rhodobacteraceae bacterium]|nr:WecB/TagA/CpsF family glycosyltransferase [Paracoccaceae bacterium]
MQFQFGSEQIVVNVPDWNALSVQVAQRFQSGQGFALATINLDHLVKLKQDARFRAAYAQQDLVVADGNPIVWLSHLAGRPVSVLPGSDLVKPLCELAAETAVRVALVGSTSEALQDAAETLCKQVPGLEIVLCLSPSHGFDATSPEAGEVLNRVEQSGAGLCLLALGAPRQEELAARGRQLTPGVGFVSVGAGLDFLGGHQTRAPRWVRRIGMEWLWRAVGSPARLGPRYLRCLAILPGQCIAALRLRRS